ncbi:MAG: hypothetical protein IJ662_11465 [Clostridia bacterium]|nr:hypothetical protein [Clostridia bacterium]
MESAKLLFFNGREGALPLYGAFRARLFALVPDVEIKVRKTQISYYRRHMFACVSFLPARNKPARPQDYITVTFGLPTRVDSSRIDIACQPQPNRWTHHVLIGSIQEIDDEMMRWIQQAAAFAAR